MRMRLLTPLLLLPGLALGQSPSATGTGSVAPKTAPASTSAPAKTAPTAAAPDGTQAATAPASSSAPATAQVTAAPTTVPPPLIDAQTAESGPVDTMATPAAPGGVPAVRPASGTMPAPGSTVPGAPAASPFGTPPIQTKPGPEIGLMVTEVAFGALSAAGTALLPYLLFQKVGIFGAPGAGDPMISDIVTLLAIAGTPLAVSSTQIGIANQSRHFYSEAWPSQLAGLGAQAAVIGVFYLAGGFPRPGLAGLNRPNGELALLVGTLGIVPLASMAAINLTKTPRTGRRCTRGLGALTVAPDGSVRVGLPAPVPLMDPAKGGALSGLMLPVASGAF